MEDVWPALERAGAQTALVRFSGGAGRQATLESVSIEAQGRELARWCDAGESELAGTLAAPAWGRYGSFRGQPRITATLAWTVADRSILLAGTRGTERFEETLQAAVHTPAAVRDTSPSAAGDDQGSPQAGRGDTHTAARACSRCGRPIPHGARPEARYCAKRCRQAASRARLRDRSGRSALTAPERCAWCSGPMPPGLRPEARYCAKRCRQAASRARLALTSSQPTTSDASRDTSPPNGHRRRSGTRA